MSYTPVTVALLADLRKQQGRKLHQARHLWIVPPLRSGSSGQVPTEEPQ